MQQRSDVRWASGPVSPLIPSQILHLAMVRRALLTVRELFCWRLQIASLEVASVGFPAFGRKALAGIRSALFFASCPLRFHLIVDHAGESDMQAALASLEPWLRSRGTERYDASRQDLM